jgi:hypothetical protein
LHRKPNPSRHNRRKYDRIRRFRTDHLIFEIVRVHRVSRAPDGIILRSLEAVKV